MPQLPENMNDQSWGYWSLDSNFQASPSTIDEWKIEGFETGLWYGSLHNSIEHISNIKFCNRIKPIFEVINLSTIEAEFLLKFDSITEKNAEKSGAFIEDII